MLSVSQRMTWLLFDFTTLGTESQVLATRAVSGFLALFANISKPRRLPLGS